jgi:hypothetical protein
MDKMIDAVFNMPPEVASFSIGFLALLSPIVIGIVFYLLCTMGGEW